MELLKKNGFLQLFLFAEAMVYLLYITLDLFFAPMLLSGIIKFTGILLCVLYSFSHKIQKREGCVPLITALFFTMTADIFLLFTGYFSAGILLFCVVQGLYRFYLKGSRGLLLYYLINSAAALFIFLILIFFIGTFPGMLCFFAVFYILCLLYNIITALRIPGMVIFASALILLLLCDLNVGISNLNECLNVTVPSWLTISSANLIWIFYLPSQIIITICTQVPQNK